MFYLFCIFKRSGAVEVRQDRLRLPSMQVFEDSALKRVQLKKLWPACRLCLYSNPLRKWTAGNANGITYHRYPAFSSLQSLAC